jgi:hypothetical protein
LKFDTHCSIRRNIKLRFIKKLCNTTRVAHILLNSTQTTIGWGTADFAWSQHLLDETLKAPATVHDGSQTDDTDCRQRTELLYRNGHFANLSGALVAGISAAVLWPIVDPGKLIIWLGLYSLLFLARGLLVHSFKRAAAPVANAHNWLQALTISIACNGALWGALGFFFRFDWDTGYQIFLLAVLALMAAGAIAAYGASMGAYYAFVLPMLLPNAAHLLFTQGRAYVVMGVIVMLYCLSVGVLRGAHRGKQFAAAVSVAQRKCRPAAGTHQRQHCSAGAGRRTRRGVAGIRRQ